MCAPKAFPGANADALPTRAAIDAMVATNDFIFLVAQCIVQHDKAGVDTTR